MTTTRNLFDTAVTATLTVDVTGDFTEDGRLPVTGGRATALNITEFLRQHPTGPSGPAANYASRENHKGGTDNGGHFHAPGQSPDYVTTFPEHGTPGHPGAEYDPGFDATLVTDHVLKGWDSPAFSMFQGTVFADGTDTGVTLADSLRNRGVTRVVVMGIATDFCVRHTALDALRLGFEVVVLDDLCVGVNPAGSTAALAELATAGATVTNSTQV